MKLILFILGISITLMGLLWVGQGLGIIHWPASSFMLEQVKWSYYGGITVVIGLFLCWYARRIK